MFRRCLLTALLAGVALSGALADGQCSADGGQCSAPPAKDVESTKEDPTKEVHGFEAEVSRLMDIIVHSLYSDKLVFLRELISNAADALEKARFHSVTDPSYLGNTKDLDIKLEFDEDAKTLSIIDTGIGMTKADLIGNLGTVAKSGTTNFLEAMKEGGDANLIGQFGVGFYSAFLVADKVTVTSKNNEDAEQHVWESAADASFSVAADPRGDTLGRGSRVTLHLKEDAHDLLDEKKIKELIGKYSGFVQFPIYVKSKKEVKEAVEEDDDDDIDEDEEEVSDKPKKDTVVYEWEQVNTQKAIWLRSKDEVTQEEYNEFYKGFSKDYKEHLAHTHFNAEGEVEFKSLLFIPEMAPFDYQDKYWTKKPDVKLFVRRVLVAEEVEDLLPRYLNFIRGVVDSDDIPLNVSRENLQQNKLIKVIGKMLTKKVLDLLKKLASEEDKEDETKDEDDEEEAKDEKKPKKKLTKYMKFYKEFGKSLKYGAYEDDANRAKLAKLLRFHSTKYTEEMTSLAGYVERMKEGQEHIYYMSGDDRTVMEKLPVLKMFKKKDLEVLMFDGSMDEMTIQKIEEFDGKKFMSIQKNDLKLPETEEEKKHFARVEKKFEPLCKWMKKELSDVCAKGILKSSQIHVMSVKVTKRELDVPCIVVTPPHAFTAQQEKQMRAQGQIKPDHVSSYVVGQKQFELNAKHPVVQDLLKAMTANPDDAKAKETTTLLFQTAILESGYEIVDPSALVKSIYGLMTTDIGIDASADLVDVELPEEKEEEENDDEEEVVGDDDKEESEPKEEESKESEAKEEEPKEEESKEEVESKEEESKTVENVVEVEPKEEL